MRGIVYVVTDNLKYRNYAFVSIFSLRKSGYKGPICCLTNIELNFPDNLDVTIKEIEVSGNNPFERSRSIKTSLNEYTPYRQTLFLDCDTLILGDINPVFFIHEEFSVAFDYKPTVGKLNSDDVKGSIDDLKCTKDLVGHKYPYFSSSTILWRKSDLSDQIFKAWNVEWQKFKKVDQPALIRALYNNDVIIIPMSQKYNFPSDNAESYADAEKAQAVVYAVWGTYRDLKVLQYVKDNNLSAFLVSI